MKTSETLELLNEIKTSIKNSSEASSSKKIESLEEAMNKISKFEITYKELKQLQNRCLVMSKGLLCQWCPMECEFRKAKYEESNE